MKVLTVVGKSNSGKNGMIEHALVELIRNPDCSIMYASCVSAKNGRYKNCSKGSLIQIINYKIQNGLNGDLNIQLIVISIHGKIVAVTTYGDSFLDIKQAIEMSFKVCLSIDLFVCARHSCNDNSDLKETLKAHNQNVVFLDSFLCERSNSKDKKKWNSDNEIKGKLLAKRIMDEV